MRREKGDENLVTREIQGLEFKICIVWKVLGSPKDSLGK